MEDSKRIYKFFGKPGEDFQLWVARTEAALNAKEVKYSVDENLLAVGADALDEDTKKAAATASAVIIQGLGDKPLQLCLSDKAEGLQSKLSRMPYSRQVMGEYFDKCEEIFNRLACMGSEIKEDMQISLLLSSFGYVNRSKFGNIINSLQTVHDKLSWESATARLLQAYDDVLFQSGEEKGFRPKDLTESSHALTASKGGKSKFHWKNQHRRRVERRCCCECHQVGHLARDCPSRGSTSMKTVRLSDKTADFETPSASAKQATLLIAVSKEESAGNSLKDFAMKQEPCAQCNFSGHSVGGCVPKSALLETRVEPTRGLEASSGVSNFKMTVRTSDEIISAESLNGLLLDSGSSDHMTPRLEWLAEQESIPSRPVVLGDGKKVLANKRDTLTIRTALRGNGETFYRTLNLKNVLFVPALETSLISISRLCEEDYTISFSTRRCVALQDGPIEFYGHKTRGIYQVDGVPLQSSSSFANTAIVSSDTLKLWHQRLGHANSESVKRPANSGASKDLNCTVSLPRKSIAAPA